MTASFYYMVLYVVSPFLGGLVGSVTTTDGTRIWNHFLVVAVGSFLTTFLLWIIIDPAAGLLEMLLLASRVHRRQRLAQAEILRRQQQAAKQRILTEVEAAGKTEQEHWDEILRPHAEKLAQLLANNGNEENLKEKQVVDIGLNAWQMGGLVCMQHLHSMVVDICRKKYPAPDNKDYVSIWWDGIGAWQDDWLDLQKDGSTDSVISNCAA